MQGTKTKWSNEGDHHKSTWQRRPALRTCSVFHLRSGWCFRLTENGKEITRAFPYDSPLDAATAAERIAEERWGPPEPPPPKPTPW